jgi:hypothetical protein
MANSFILLGIYKLDTERLTVDGESVDRERNQVAGFNDDDIATVNDTDPAGSEHGLTVRPLNVVSPLPPLYASDLSIVSGANSDLDFQIPNGITGKLMRIEVASTMRCKWTLKHVVDGVAGSTLAVFFTNEINQNYPWTPPDKGFHALVGAASNDYFRLNAENVADTGFDGEAHATCYMDQV